MRLVRIYATLVRVLASYLGLRLLRPFLGAEAYEARLATRHRKNARRIERAIVRAGGLFIKVGQLISILTNFLPEEFRRELEGLQDQLPPRAYAEIAARIRAEFGAEPDALFATFDREPIATASLAQVHVATMPDGRRVAVKAQHADIERVARQDLVIIRRILHIVQLFTGVRGLESYHPEISQMIAEELDFTMEAGHIRTIGAHFAGDRMVRVPSVVPDRSTRRVLTTEYVTGTKITDFPELASRGLHRRRLAERVVAAYCRMIFVDGIYHADPHPGNILVAPDGAIVFLDFGAVGVLAPRMKQGIPRFLEGVIKRNPSQITEAIREMGFVARDAGAADVAERVIEYVQRRFLEQATEASWGLGSMQLDMRTKLEALADLRRLDVSFRKLTATFQVPRDWVLLERTLLLLLGLCTELDPDWNPMAVIRPYLEDVVLGNERNWGEMLGGSLKEMALTAATLPENLQRTLVRANRGELEVRVPEIARAARLLYAGMQQMIFGALATGCGVIAYSAYSNHHERVAVVTLFLSAVFLTTMTGSMLASRRYRV
ncbi:MAG TPA: AarF/UbiB family protein [Gemmatimonadaceae bacterium]|nr:AarF/UbiB family protein [Gemmatimonadaceae bacterium]